MTFRPLSAALVVALAIPSSVAAQTQHAHVHGLAYADVAVDGDAVTIQLRATAYDLVGFEREPRDDAERAKVQAARDAVLAHGTIWQFSVAAQCAAEPPLLDVPASAHDHDHEGHDHDHDHDHSHEHDHDHGEKGAHADWTVTYAIRCASPANLRSIDTGLFTAFPSLQTVRVQLLDAGGAREVTLTPDAKRLTLAR